MILPNLNRVDRLAIDTETSGLTYTSRPVGISWALPGGEKGYARWGHECGGNDTDPKRVKEWLEREVNRQGLTVYMHNAGFDLRMLAYDEPGDHHLPGLGARLDRCRVEDTGFMAALLDELEPSFHLDDLAQKHCGLRKRGEALWEWCAETFDGSPTRKAQGKNIWRAPGDVVEEYAEHDALITLALADALRPRLTEEGLEEVYDLETSLIPLLLQMHLTGVRVDLEAAEQIKRDLRERQRDLQARWDSLVGEGVNWGSTVQLAKVFDENGIPYNETEKGNPSITKDLLQATDHPLADLIIELRRNDHYAGTFVDSYILDTADSNGLIHGEFHPLRNAYYGTVSGRFSSGGDLNLQNIPARDEVWAPLIRGLFVPYYDGGRWLKADSNQIEFRFLAHYAGGQLREAYVSDPDVDFHQACADLVGIDRRPAKNTNFGLVYGMGKKKMAAQLGLPLHEAEELLEEYHRRLPEVRQIYRRADRRAAARGFIVTWGGRKRRFRRRGRRYEKTHIALNALLQGSAADLIKRQMLAIQDLIDWERTPLHLTVHDEVDLTVPEGPEGEEFARRVRERMEDFQLTVPVKVDCELGPDWGHVKDLELEEAV